MKDQWVVSSWKMTNGFLLKNSLYRESWFRGYRLPSVKIAIAIPLQKFINEVFIILILWQKLQIQFIIQVSRRLTYTVLDRLRCGHRPNKHCYSRVFSSIEIQSCSRNWKIFMFRPRLRLSQVSPLLVYVCRRNGAVDWINHALTDDKPRTRQENIRLKTIA